jgi:putative SbcD/Mre11-related phosphoesterase
MSRLCKIGPGRFAHASGALWLPDHKAALIADAHMGYAWAQRRRGELGPLVTGGIREKLESLLDELSPATVVFLGDLVHAPRPLPEERAFIEETFAVLRARVNVIAVRGNHDRSFGRDFKNLGLKLENEWRVPGMLAIHGDTHVKPQRGEHLVMGHLHPTVTITDAASACRKLPAFLSSTGLTAIPAFSPFAGGAPWISKELFGRGRVRTVVVTGTRAVDVSRSIRKPSSEASER